jgi:hypothetical protein
MQFIISLVLYYQCFGISRSGVALQGQHASFCDEEKAIDYNTVVSRLHPDQASLWGNRTERENREELPKQPKPKARSY